MNSKDFSKALQDFSAKIAEGLPAINEKVALNAYAMTKNRIINEGTIGAGESLGDYSDNELPAFFFKGKALNSGGESFYQKRVKMHEGISYKEWREANGRPTDHVTLSFSGTTFNDIGVIKQLRDGIKVVTIVGPKNTKIRPGGKTTSEIVGYLQERYGDFIAPNQEEQEILKATLSSEVNKLIKKSL